MSFSNKLAGAKLVFVFLAALALASCGGNTGTNSEVRLQGAGATFPNPLCQKWLSEYGKLNANIKIDYQSIGSATSARRMRR